MTRNTGGDLQEELIIPRQQADVPPQEAKRLAYLGGLTRMTQRWDHSKLSGPDSKSSSSSSPSVRRAAIKAGEVMRMLHPNRKVSENLTEVSPATCVWLDRAQN